MATTTTKISLTERELVPIVTFYMGANAWGGNDPGIMLAQGEIHDVLDVKAFAARINKASRDGAFDSAKFSAKPRAYALSAPAVSVLRQILGRPGQDNVAALLALSALRRIDKTLGADKGSTA